MDNQTIEKFPIKEGDVVICIKHMNVHSTNRDLKFEIGDKCTIAGFKHGDVYVGFDKKRISDFNYCFSLDPIDKYYFYDYFISIAKYRKTKIDELLNN